MGACMSMMQPGETREDGANTVNHHTNAMPLNVWGSLDDEFFETSDHIFLKVDKTIAHSPAERQALQEFAQNPSRSIQKMFDSLLTARLEELGPLHALSSKHEFILKLQRDPLNTIQEYTKAAFGMHKDHALNAEMFEDIFDEMQAYRRAESCCLMVLRHVQLSLDDGVAVKKMLCKCQYNRSLCHEQLGQYEDCISCSKGVLSDEHFTIDAIMRMGLCHKRLGHYEDCISCWLDVVHHNLASSSTKIEAIIRLGHCFMGMAAREGEKNGDDLLRKAMRCAEQAERHLANDPKLPPDLTIFAQKLKSSLDRLQKLPTEFDYAKGIDSLDSFGVQRGGGAVARALRRALEHAMVACVETPGWLIEAKARAKAAVVATADDGALKRIPVMYAAEEKHIIETAFSAVAYLDNKIEAALSIEDYMIRTRLDKFFQLKNEAEESEKQVAFSLGAAIDFKENRNQKLDEILRERRGSLQKYCQTQLWSQECSRLEEDQSLSTAEIECMKDEMSVLRTQLEEREQSLQKIVRRRDLVQENLSKFKESCLSTLQSILEDETNAHELVLKDIDRRYADTESSIHDASIRYRRLKKRIEDLECKARVEYAAWQCDVCAKVAEQISLSDMVMLFCAAGLAEEHQRAVLEQDVDGATFVGLSLHTLAEDLGVRSVNHRLLLQHVAESIKTRNLASLFTPCSSNNPLSWGVEQVLQWLLREDLGVLSEAVGRERISGLALMQLNDESIKHLFNLKVPLKTLASINFKLQELQASTIGIIQATFSSVRPDIRNSVIAGLAAAIDGGDPVDVPMALLCEWTENFGASMVLGSGSFGEVFRAYFSNSDRSSCGLVAVKRINPALNLSSREQQRSDAITAMKREISVLRAFRHPGIIRLLGYSLPAEGLSARLLPAVTNACLIYELGMRGTLHSLLSNQVTAVQLSWERRLRLALDVAHALNYMHSREPGNPAFHRDVKSSNIVVNESWHAKLIDCGLAKYIPSQEVPGLASLACETNAGQRFGTLAYMCPEYNRGYSTYDAKSEVFSFGIVLGELLTGKLQQPPVVIMERMLLDAEQMPPDAFAGNWPPACATALRGLALQCMADKAHRTASMLHVVKQLSPLVSEYCAQTALEVAVQNELLSLYRNQQHQVVADAMKQREAIILAKERSQRQQRTCCVCYDDDKDATSVIQCPNTECNSHICLECFQRDIRVQCGHEERSQFVRNHCSIVCCMCRQHEFTDRDVIAFADDTSFAILRKACNDVVELQAYKKATSEFQSEVEEMRSELMRVQGANEQRIYRHRLYICEHILTLKCPRRDCGNAVLDFVGCFAVNCSCGCGFCAWCMADCGHDAHAHVLQCPKSANAGSLYGTFAQFERTHRERRRIAVQQYLSSLPQEDAEKVQAAIARDVAFLEQDRSIEL